MCKENTSGAGSQPGEDGAQRPEERVPLGASWPMELDSQPAGNSCESCHFFGEVTVSRPRTNF